MNCAKSKKRSTFCKNVVAKEIGSTGNCRKCFYTQFNGSFEKMNKPVHEKVLMPEKLYTKTFFKGLDKTYKKIWTKDRVFAMSFFFKKKKQKISLAKKIAQRHRLRLGVA